MDTAPLRRPFGMVLVANRGEIAVRVIRTLRRLGIRSVAVYSDADAAAPHVTAADEAVRIGPAAATSSYLDIDAVLAAARATGADAVHPGYGFLSENPAFARACGAAGITLIGPPPEAMEAMADKIAARDLVAARGVPVLPGTTGVLSDAELVGAADAVGFPLIVKPAAGGGGKGMQVADDAAALPAALASARRVARSAFGDDTLLLERYVPRPRHIEVQVLADAHGNVIHLGERECSLQRRHQKVIEEAPSALLAGLPAPVAAAVRSRMGEAACEVARACGYVGAGTVEMLVPGDALTSAADRAGEGQQPGSLDFWFLEMNTRLQVEHPVTEAVTGLDLVELQLRVAAGEKLPLAQDDVTLTGHAVEARLYAETPARGFLPDTGTVLAYREPAGPGVRVDSGIAERSVVGGDYDPMLAKIVAHGPDRATALARLDRALAGTVVLGVGTNLNWLRILVADDDVAAGRLDTGLIERLPAPEDPAPEPADLRAAARALAADPVPPGPWAPDGFRPGAPAEPRSHTIAGETVVAGIPAPSDPREGAPAVVVQPRGRSGPAVRTVWLHRDGRTLALDAPTREQAFAARRAERAAAAAGGPGAGPDLRSAMPGTVVHVAPPGPVTAGTPLVVVEAMKMEHPLLAPHDGVATLHVAAGDQVSRDQLVATVAPAEHAG
ncbi:acetyl/propionyl/methylcrotonyl-CoA carboxylase subunit alpha [Myceligenerans crystallogenes]|uniref:biotin carboxylase n=1 Tax=Myceligenerans crystallogenes TaxID=316335 RepID=A0ABP4ZGS8_9MICO